MLVMPSFKKSLIVEQFQGNYLKVMLHETIRNGDFKGNTALQCWNNVSTIQFNVVTIMLRCVALKIVNANRPL